jgi:hypothetical protein
VKKFLLGLVVLLGLLLIAGIVSSILVYSFFKNNMPDPAPLEAVEKLQEERFGGVTDFVPTILEPQWVERIDTYVRIKHAVRPLATATSGVLDDAASTIASPEFKESSKLSQIRQLIASRQEAIDLARFGLRYLTQRDSLLLENDMSRGEFAYLQGIVLFSWLQWDPDARGSLGDSTDVRAFEVRMDTVRDDARNLVRRLFRHHLEGLRAVDAPDSETLHTRELLAAEWERLRADPRLFPFEGNLTPGLRAALQPHESELRAMLPRGLGESLVAALAFQQIEIHGRGLEITSY